MAAPSELGYGRARTMKHFARSTMRFALVAAAATGCTFFSPNALDIPEAHFDLSEPFSYTRLDAPLADAASLVETAQWEQAVAISLVMTDFSFGPGELTLRSGVPYALKIDNLGVWPHTFGAKHFFRAIAVRSIEPAPFDGPTASEGGAVQLITDPYGPSAVFHEVAVRPDDAGVEAIPAAIPEPPFSAIELGPRQAVIVYFVPVREGKYYLRSVRTDDLLRGMRGRIIIE